MKLSGAGMEMAPVTGSYPVGVLYRVVQNVEIAVREEPDMNSAKTGIKLKIGDKFAVDDTKVANAASSGDGSGGGGGGQTFLRLVDGGWAFEFHPKLGTRVCEFYSDKQAAAEAHEAADVEYSRLKKDTKKQIALTENKIKEAEGTKSYAALPRLKVHLDELNTLYLRAKALKPQQHASATDQGNLLRQLLDLNQALPEMPRESTLSDEPIEFGLLTDSPVALPDKFTAGKLISGQPEEAAHGIAHYMGIGSQQLGEMISGGLDAIRAEFEKGGDVEDVANMRYILDEAAHEVEERVSYGLTMKDKGHNNMRLNDFLKLREAKTAKLEATHIAALRLYSSQSYKCINDPLRRGDKPHPFAATTYFLSEGLKKLRSINATATKVQQHKEFWRGMKDLELNDKFKRQGGTELGCMSTSTSKEIVAGYANSAQPLVFRVKSSGFMSCGADISWLSVYPNEAEVLYPPLTYLKYLRTTPIKNSGGFVIDVEPTFST
jgi:hypothetical protein